jgi:hypothetical protein
MSDPNEPPWLGAYEPNKEPFDPMEHDGPVTHLGLPCGCVVDVSHVNGHRRVTCFGGGTFYRQAENGEKVQEFCTGGRGYAVSAQATHVLYTVEPILISGVEWDGSATPPPEG